MHRFLLDYTAAIEASLRCNGSKKTAVWESSCDSSFADIHLNVDMGVDLTNKADLENGATIHFIFGSEHCQMNGNEAVRLAQLAPQFCSKFIQRENISYNTFMGQL